jgi:hypothetical protein
MLLQVVQKQNYLVAILNENLYCRQASLPLLKIISKGFEFMSQNISRVILVRGFIPRIFDTF